MRAKYAREIRGGLYRGNQVASKMCEYPALKDFLWECFRDWARHASNTQNRAAFHAIRKERIRRGELNT